MPAEREGGMLTSYVFFHPAWLLQTTLLWSLAPFVLHRLTFFAMMEHTALEQLKVRSAIHTAFTEVFLFRQKLLIEQACRANEQTSVKDICHQPPVGYVFPSCSSC